MQQVVSDTPGLTDDRGHVPVHDTYRSKAYDDIWAVAAAAAVAIPWQTAVPTGVPKTGFPTEVRRSWPSRSTSWTARRGYVRLP